MFTIQVNISNIFEVSRIFQSFKLITSRNIGPARPTCATFGTSGTNLIMAGKFANA